MEKITEVFLNWEVLLISFAAFALLGLIRGLGTKKKDGKVIGGWAQNETFKTFLPAYPYFLTMGFVFIPGVPLPEVVTRTIAVKVLYAIYAAWLSDKSYQLVKSVLERAGVKFNQLESDTPAVVFPDTAPESKIEKIPTKPE